MGKKNKAASGAMSGAAAGSSFGPWGAGIGGVLGGLAGMGTGGDEPEQVQQVDPAFLNSLYNQSMGTEKTAADMKMKAAFDQTLAQQVAAARAARGVNPALLQRNVARLAAEQGAKAAGTMAEENLKNQADARTKYLQAVQLNQQAQGANAKLQMAADERDSKELGSLINSAGAIGSQFALANKAEKDKNDAEDTKLLNEAAAPAQKTAAPVSSTQTAADLTNAMNMGANQYDDSGRQNKFNMFSESDRRAKKDLVVVSDERQKDLIKNESLPQNGNMQQQNMQAMQPQGSTAPPVAAFAPPASAAPQVPQAGAAPAPAAPAPVPASQTALAQANASMAKGGRINDLQMQATNLPEVADGPSAKEIADMTVDAKNRQRRGHFGEIIQSEEENYAANLQRWYAQQAQRRAEREKQLGEVNKANMGVNAERMARLSKFYTGNSNTNTNDIMANYMPKNKLADTSWAAGVAALNARGGYNPATMDPNYAANQAAMRNSTMAMSDERSKQNVAESSGGSMNPKDFLDKLQAYSYEYKNSQKSNPNAGEGRHLSVMAQDLEKAGPVGKSMVQEDPQTGMKQVDYGKGFGAMLASQVQLNERIKQLEAQIAAKKAKV